MIERGSHFTAPRTALQFAHSFLRGQTRSELPENLKLSWDGRNQKTFEQTVTRLSNPHDRERVVIRDILRSKIHLIHSVLDVGCGPATEYESYQSDPQLQNFHYVGVDRSKKMIEVARARHSDIAFIQADLEQLPFQDNAFDAVLLRHVLEHQPGGYQKSIEEAVRVAKRTVIIDFFHRPLIGLPDIRLLDWNNCANNWYNKRSLENFIYSQVYIAEKINTIGTSGQRAVIYVLTK